MSTFKHSETLETIVYDENKVKKERVGKYQHFKGGMYEVVGLIWLNQCFVIYKSTEGVMWGRPYHLFFGFKEKDGELIPRFIKQN